MRRARPTQAYVHATMPGARRSSYIDLDDQSEEVEENYRQREANRQREIQRGAGLCAHLNRHGCGLGATKSEYGLCSPCSYFCTHSEDDPRTANTDTTNMTYQESAVLDLALARKIMFCDSDIEPTRPANVEAAAAAAELAQQAERQAAAYERLQRDMAAQERARETQQAAVNDEEMEDAPEAEAEAEAGPSRGPALQRGPSQRGPVNRGPVQGRASASGTTTGQRGPREGQQRQAPRSEAEMLRDPEIMAYLSAANAGPVRPHPPPISLMVAQARAQHSRYLAKRTDAAERERLEQQVALRREQREQHRLQLEKHRLQKQRELEAQDEASLAGLTGAERAERKRKMRAERDEQARQQLARLQQAGREQARRQQERIQQERLQRQQLIEQRKQLQEEEGMGEEKAEAPAMVREQRMTLTLPLRQPLPVATRRE